MAAEEAVKAVLAATGTGRWVGFSVAESTVTDDRQEKRGAQGRSRATGGPTRRCSASHPVHSW